VPQDPNDEPAASFLEQRKNSSRRSSMSGAIKDGPPAIFAPIIVAQPPAGWALVKSCYSYDVGGGIQKTPERRPVSNHYPTCGSQMFSGAGWILRRFPVRVERGRTRRWRLEPDDLLIVEGNAARARLDDVLYGGVNQGLCPIRTTLSDAAR